MKKKNCFAAAMTLAAISSLTVSAAEVSYEPAEGSSGPYSWATAANWSGETLPSSGDDVVLSASRLAAEKLVLGAGESAPSSENWNLGWFAVVGRKTPFGTTLLVR